MGDSNPDRTNCSLGFLEPKLLISSGGMEMDASRHTHGLGFVQETSKKMISSNRPLNNKAQYIFKKKKQKGRIRGLCNNQNQRGVVCKALASKGQLQRSQSPLNVPNVFQRDVLTIFGTTDDKEQAVKSSLLETLKHKHRKSHKKI